MNESFEFSVVASTEGRLKKNGKCYVAVCDARPTYWILNASNHLSRTIDVVENHRINHLATRS